MLLTRRNGQGPATEAGLGYESGRRGERGTPPPTVSPPRRAGESARPSGGVDEEALDLGSRLSRPPGCGPAPGAAAAPRPPARPRGRPCPPPSARELRSGWRGP